MSYHWKKSNLRVVIDSDPCKDRSEVLDLSDKFDDNFSRNSELIIVNTHDQDHEDDSKNGDNDSETAKPGKRNPKCARCANHVREPVAVKGMFHELMLSSKVAIKFTLLKEHFGWAFPKKKLDIQ